MLDLEFPLKKENADSSNKVMEKLSIKNFLCIKEADFEVGRFNIIIGSQASGKSVISKLLYFFRGILTQEFGGLVKDFKEENISRFTLYFPKYTWGKQQFEIIYQNNRFKISLKHELNSLRLIFSENLINLYDKSQKDIDDRTGLISLGKLISNKEDFYSVIRQQHPNHILFIPASRAFFSHLQKNIFLLLTQGIEIEQFIKEFGSHYEIVKRAYNKNIKSQKESLDNKIEYLVESILKGKYVYKLEQDWIETNGQRINLSSTSSGQQEALPMLLMLSVWAEQNRNARIFIEEPEAHLFPVSQKHVISLISLIYNQWKHDFVLTTHSPYILTAINNAILAYDVIKEKGTDAVKDIFDPDFAIKYEDVKAYTIEDGCLISIMDDEARLIGASVIDSISDEFENVFNNLLDL